MTRRERYRQKHGITAIGRTNGDQLHSKIFCGKCGGKFLRRYWKGNTSIFWKCENADKKKGKKCDAEIVREKEILDGIVKERFKEIEKNADRLAEIIAEYGMISDRLEESLSSGFIDEFTKKTIMDMSERVLENIARSYENIRKGVGTVMGGKILDYEAKRIRNEGWNAGRNEGRNEGLNEGINKGRSEGISGTVDILRDIGLDDKSIITKIMEKYNLSQKEAEGYVLTSAVM